MYITIKKSLVECRTCSDRSSDVRIEVDTKNLVIENGVLTFRPVAELYIECQNCGEAEYLRGEGV